MTTPQSTHQSAQPAVETLVAAARTARKTGLTVWVVLERAPRVTAQLRIVAEQEQVDVTIELTDLGIISYFGVAPEQH